MRSDCITGAHQTAGGLHGLITAGSGGSVLADSRAMAVYALISWLITESLGAIMLASWISSGAARERHSRPDGMSLPVLAGHAGLAFSGFVCWISFLASSSVVVAWLALAFLAPAIGLGISTVTVWTPFPVRQSETVPEARSGPRAGPADSRGAGDRRPSLIPNEMLERAMDDEALTSGIVDDMLTRMLAEAEPEAKAKSGMGMKPLIPLAHGVMAVATFLLAMVSAALAV